jgi:hypothetical protein
LKTASLRSGLRLKRQLESIGSPDPAPNRHSSKLDLRSLIRICHVITDLNAGGAERMLVLRAELKEMAHDVLLSDSATARNIFRKDYVQRLLAEHMSGDYNHQARLWGLLMLELWFRMWVDQPVERMMQRPQLELAA